MRRTSWRMNISSVTCSPGSSSGSSGATSPIVRTARTPMPATLGPAEPGPGTSRSSSALMVLSACLSSLLSATAGCMDCIMSMGSGRGSSMARSGPSASTLRSAAMVVADAVTRRSVSPIASRDMASMAATASSTRISCAYEPSLENTTLSTSFIGSVSTGSSAPPVSSPDSSVPSRRRAGTLELLDAAAEKVGPVASGVSTGAVEKLVKEEIILARRSTSRRVELPYSSLCSAARMRGLLSVSRRRDM
mmetsp:Transcript_18140/g.45712  ORF Transcript_18140/g.45712 Transcript_18140/m.45712 type:complete len:249 (-) Transcript_18140:2323-3069(-)